MDNNIDKRKRALSTMIHFPLNKNWWTLVH